jgi:hypothetical protein
MENYSLTPIEKEMLNFNFDQLHMQKEEAKKNIAGARSASDITSEICNVWKKIGRFVKLAEGIPVVGKFIKILADLLDSLCG